MAEYSTNFSEYTSGSKPSDWTRRFTGANNVWTVENVSGATGGKVLRHNTGISDENLEILTWDDVDADAARDNVEILVRARIVTGGEKLPWESQLGPIARTTPTFEGVSAGHDREQQRISEAGVNVVTQADSPLTEGDTWYWINERVNGGNLYSRIWKDGETKPDWQLTSSNYQNTSVGSVGVWRFYSTKIEYDVFIVATDGDATEIPVSVNANVTGSGGIEFGGSADYEFDRAPYNYTYTGTGGLRFGYSAIYSFAGVKSYTYTGSGGLQLAGKGSYSLFQSGGIQSNSEWTNIEPENSGTFLYGRLQNQINWYACRDSGPEVIGTPDGDLVAEEYSLIYAPSTGEFLLNDEVLYTWTGDSLSKIDFTFDVWGYPVLVWTTEAGDLYLRHWDQDTATYTNLQLDTGASDCFVCLAERRVPETKTSNHIYLIYRKANEVLYRTFLENEYSTLRRTSVEVNNSHTFRIEGVGLTTDYKLQIRSRYLYVG